MDTAVRDELIHTIERWLDEENHPATVPDDVCLSCNRESETVVEHICASCSTE